MADLPGKYSITIAFLILALGLGYSVYRLETIQHETRREAIAEAERALESSEKNRVLIRQNKQLTQELNEKSAVILRTVKEIARRAGIDTSNLPDGDFNDNSPPYESGNDEQGREGGNRKPSERKPSDPSPKPKPSNEPKPSESPLICLAGICVDEPFQSGQAFSTHGHHPSWAWLLMGSAVAATFAVVSFYLYLTHALKQRRNRFVMPAHVVLISLSYVLLVSAPVVDSFATYIAGLVTGNIALGIVFFNMRTLRRPHRTVGVKDSDDRR